VRRLLVQMEDRVRLHRCVALMILALAGTAIVLPEASARPGGISGGGRMGGFRAPFAAHRAMRAAPLHRAPGAHGATLQRGFVGPRSRPAGHFAAHGIGRNIAPDLRSRFVRRHHRGFIAGYGFPFTSEGYGDAPYYLGTPYDPSEAIPVYGPPSVDDQDVAPPSRRLVPRQSGLREENQDACRSERVTVPESNGNGEREINVVRC
jgi:hypothetical protein